MKVQKETHVTVTMSERQAIDLAVFLQAESFRRRQHFAKTSVMQCWGCLGACEDLLEGLKKAGFHPSEGHLGETEDDHSEQG